MQRDEDTENDSESETEEEEEEENKLPFFKELFLSNKTIRELVEDERYYANYVKPVNYFDDRKKFLKTLETQMKKELPKMNSCVRYQGNKLIFDYPNKRSFPVTHQIHMIVYRKIRENKRGKKSREKKKEK